MCSTVDTFSIAVKTSANRTEIRYVCGHSRVRNPLKMLTSLFSSRSITSPQFLVFDAFSCLVIEWAMDAYCRCQATSSGGHKTAEFELCTDETTQILLCYTSKC